WNGATVSWLVNVMPLRVTQITLPCPLRHPGLRSLEAQLIKPSAVAGELAGCQPTWA
ncbi:hypothetical protein QQF64_014001, partial [Cirrhinus molitorella]